MWKKRSCQIDFPRAADNAAVKRLRRKMEEIRVTFSVELGDQDPAMPKTW
jgi:hypothetical protein